jgi:hypothetical protein
MGWNRALQVRWQQGALCLGTREGEAIMEDDAASL